jgi:hypothetical protein
MVADNGWNEYQKLVLAELERHNELLESVRREVQEMRTEIAVLKIKVIGLGVLAGWIASVIGTIVMKYLGG